MQNVLLVFACLFALAFECSVGDQQNENRPAVKDTRATPTATPDPTATPISFPSEPAEPSFNTNTSSSTKPASEGLIEKLKKWAGQYPYDVKLLDEPELKSRLAKFMGGDFATMKKYFNVETPIEIKKDVLKTSGCEAHNCGANMYVLFVDLEKDNINVYHLNDNGVTKTYFEKGKIDLPAELAEDLK